MIFSSYEFLFIFLPIVLGLYYFTTSPRLKLYILAISSYVFYGYWNYKFLPLLLFSTYIDYWVGQKLEESETERSRKKYLLISLVTNLSLLGFFKYFYFMSNNINFISSLLGAKPLYELSLEIVLPVGISFYTFQSMSYTIDLYRRHSQAYRDFVSFAAYVALFPQLIAGPIVRHNELVVQMVESTKKKISSYDISRGIFFLSIGLVKKVILADRIGYAIDPAIGLMSSLSTLEAWLCTVGYTLQLYFDFSGYSDMAVGLGFFLGVKLPQNFNSPYKAQSITDFWRRWHITLSSWLRDYLYISLGGNKKSNFRTYLNLIITMFLGGLWHGANWAFAIWGLFHGFLLMIEKFVHNNYPSITTKLPRVFKVGITFFLVMMGWVVFRAENMQLANAWFSKMFSFEGGFKLLNFSTSSRDRFAVVLVLGLFIVFKTANTFELEKRYKFSKLQACCLGLLLALSVMFFAKESPFLYFQF